MTPLRRAYARQRLESYRRDTIRRRRDFARDVMWAAFYLIVIAVLLLSWMVE